MKILLILILIDIFELTSLPAWDANAKFSQNDLHILEERSIIRGYYKDVASQSNGAIISSARANIFARPSIDNSPLRNSIYFTDAVAPGHVYFALHQSLIVEFLQAYEINKIRYWMVDVDARVTTMQIYIVGSDRQTETLILDDFVQPGVHTLKFPDQLVSKIRFYNKGGNTINSFMALIKIQAYYAF
ncbi:unnamed protein product (macronuclear) [Paramecium tetraurelia]|uniref:Uncharacterized protein n=1 Tax=Paramecium tetraurelia TaxID=5888 RepID=A0DA22_PARTE|nr:uncharacterized protein GSPATT00014821001 [Paramecium tetraurelia]CAK79889.1 unnamed protein product [Paramecium tetraurelia]|eukprot:XP_001447286.1 hypothetical protein (macronuclear) [Paramecium tetraurelia strain d4-2]